MFIFQLTVLSRRIHHFYFHRNSPFAFSIISTEQQSPFYISLLIPDFWTLHDQDHISTLIRFNFVTYFNNKVQKCSDKSSFKPDKFK